MEHKVKQTPQKRDLYDVVFPKNDKLFRSPPPEAFLESIREVQLEPIGIGKNDSDGEFFIFGRKRLLALRILVERGDLPTNTKVNCILFEPVTLAEGAIFSLQENAHRSPNEISDYRNIILTMKNDPAATYATIAKEAGVSAQSIRALAEKWSKCPTWALLAVLAGDMSMSTAKAVAKATPTIQKTLEKQCKANEGLTANDVKAERYITTKDLIGTVDLFAKQKIKVFPRSDLEALRDMFKTSAPSVGIGALDALLNKTV